MRTVLSTFCELAGIAVLVVGGWWLAPWVGMVVLGLGLFVLSRAIDPPKPTEQVDLLEAETDDAPRSEVAPPPGLDWSPT